VTLIIFMKIYSLMPFDAFNGSLVEQCLILGCRTEISDTFTHSRKREGKITKMGQVVVTGLTGDMHRSDRCQRSQWNLSGWPGTSARVTRYASVCCRVTRHECPGDPGLSKPSRRRVIWRQRLWGAKHMSIIKSFVCYDQVLEWASTCSWLSKVPWSRNSNSLALLKGELITKLESLMGLTISSKWSCSLIRLCISKEALDKRNLQKNK
jgi:hypothetical protein